MISDQFLAKISLRSQSIYKKAKVWQWSGQKTPKVGRAEFLRPPKWVSPLGNQWNGPRSSFAWSDSPVKGMNASGDRGSTGRQTDFYSTFHKTPNRKKFTKREWEEFIEESTRESVAELAASPEFTDWVMKNANRIKLLDVSGSYSNDGYMENNAHKSCFISWR